MSDRNQDVRGLAEAITQEIYGTGASLDAVNSITNGEASRTLARWESRLAERQAELKAERDRALGEGAGLREALDTIANDPLRNHTAPGWAEEIARKALTSAPLSERAGAVFRAALSDDLDWEIVAETVGALRAELAKGGE